MSIVYGLTRTKDLLVEFSVCRVANKCPIVHFYLTILFLILNLFL